MTEALDAITGFGFREVGLNRIQAVVTPGNEGSEKLLEKLGFRKARFHTSRLWALDIEQFQVE